jgi:hypothetical protein
VIGGLRSPLALLLGPATLALGLAVLVVSNQVVVIGPFDRAQIGWGVALPLILVSPAMSVLGGRLADSPRASAAVIGIDAVALALICGVAGFVYAVAYGCAPTADLVRPIGQGVVLAIVSGAGYVLSALIAASRPDRITVGAFAASVGMALAAGAALLVAFVFLFPVVTCLPPV